MFKLIVLSGAVALLAACSSMSGGGWSSRMGSSSMGASGMSSATVDPDYNTNGAVAMRRGGPLGTSGGGPN